MAKKRGIRPLDTMTKKERESYYNSTKAEVKNYHYISQTTRLLKKEKKEREIEEELQRKREQTRQEEAVMNEKTVKFSQRKREVMEQIDQMQPDFQRFDRKYKQESEKAGKEEKAIKDKDEEIRKKNEELDQVNNKLQEIESKIDLYSEYENFLERLIDKYKIYKSISKLINRYKTLKSNLEILKKNQSNTEEAINKEKEISNRLKKENEEVEVKHTRKRSLEKKIEDLRSEMTTLQNSKEQKEIESILAKGKAGKVSLAIENIFSKVVESRKLPSKKDQKNINSKHEHRAMIAKANQEKNDVNVHIERIRETHRRLMDLKIITGELTQVQVEQSKTHEEATAKAAPNPH